MQTIQFAKEGGPVVADVTCGQAQEGSYNLLLWEADRNLIVKQYPGNFMNPDDDSYDLPTPNQANDGRILECLTTVVVTPPIKKYAVSRSGGVDTSWQGSVLLRDIADVQRLRGEDGPNLLTLGSTELVHALLADDLVDAMSVFTFPVVLGGGKKLFADGSAPRAYKLTRSRVSRSGVMIGHYERDGEIEIGDAAPD